MQRNMELIRTILLRMENDVSGRGLKDLNLWAYSKEQISYHAHIMLQEGLIEGVHTTSFESDGLEVAPTNLTWKGHEFLDLIRDQDRWNRAKAIIAQVGSAPLAVWIKVLTDLVWKNLETTESRST